MAKFFENNLRPEESFAGYNVGEPDDDIFQIKDKEYPEDIDEYIFHEPEITIEEVEEIIPNTNQNDFDIDDLIQNRSTIDEEIPVELVENIIVQDLDNDNIWNSFADEEDSNSDNLLSTAITNPIEVIEEFEKEDQKVVELKEPQKSESRKDVSFELDDDFKRQLAEQLESKKAKQKDNRFDEPEKFDVIQNTDFVPIEETDNPQYYDLSEFGNDRPSEKNINKEREKKVEQNNNQEEKNKNKSKLPWILSISAASIIVLAGLAYLIMYYLIPNFYHKEKIAKQDSTIKVEKNVTQKLEEKIEKKDDHQIEKPIEEKEVIKEVEKKVEKETEEELIARINKQFAKKEEKKVKENIKEEEKIVAKPKDDLIVEKKKDIIVKKDEIKIEKPKVVKQHEKEKSVITKEIKIPPKKEEKKIDIVKETKTIEVKKEEKKIEAVYTIQVYSSPSKEDAMDWVEKLKSKNINASLSEQMIRDVKWYRVRFGSFSTREEAKAVALRNGFSQTWVDRVK